MAKIGLPALLLGLIILPACADRSKVSSSVPTKGATVIVHPYFGERGPRHRPNVNPADVLFWSRWYGESIEPADFVSVDRTLQPAAIRGSNEYLDSILRPEAHVYGNPEAHHSFHVDPDCLLHRYDVGNLALLVYENSTYITVRVATLRVAGEPDDALVRRVMAKLLRIEPTWYFPATRTSGESLRFSTNPQYTIETEDLWVGVSGAVVDGGLYFTIFRWRGDDLSERTPGTHPLLNGRLREHWAKVKGTATP